MRGSPSGIRRRTILLACECAGGPATRRPPLILGSVRRVGISCLTLTVSVLALLVSAMTAWVALQTHRDQSMRARREFGARLDAFSLWYAQRLMAKERDPGPTDAFIPELVTLGRDAQRLGQPNAAELIDWSGRVLNRTRSRARSGKRITALHDSMLIANVVSAWVRKPLSFPKVSTWELEEHAAKVWGGEKVVDRPSEFPHGGQGRDDRRSRRRGRLRLRRSK